MAGAVLTLPRMAGGVLARSGMGSGGEVRAWTCGWQGCDQCDQCDQHDS